MNYYFYTEMRLKGPALLYAYCAWETYMTKWIIIMVRVF